VDDFSEARGKSRRGGLKNDSIGLIIFDKSDDGQSNKR